MRNYLISNSFNLFRNFRTFPSVYARSFSTEVKAKAIESSCPEGTVMTGLNIYKNGKDPVAKADSEYPDWLWELAREKSFDELPVKVRIRKLRCDHIKKVNSRNKKR